MEVMIECRLQLMPFLDEKRLGKATSLQLNRKRLTHFDHSPVNF
jgi:hypothetical protein